MSGSSDHRVGVTGVSRVGGLGVGGWGDALGGVEVGGPVGGVGSGGAEIAVEGSGAAVVSGATGEGCTARVDVLTATRGACGAGRRAGDGATVGWGAGATVVVCGLNGVPGFVGIGEAISATAVTTGTDPPAIHHSATRRSRRRAPGG
jgi:hypothetical protein